MGRQIKPDADHSFRATEIGPRATYEIEFGKGRLAYLWFRGGPDGVGYLGGAATLRALAHAILREIPAPKPKKRKGGGR